MEKIKGFIIKTFILLINAAFVVGGVFLIKNQNDKNKEDQTADMPILNESANDQGVTEEISTETVQYQQSADVSEEIPVQVPDSQNQSMVPTTPVVTSNNTSTNPSTIKSTPAPKAVPKPKKTTKTS